MRFLARVPEQLRSLERFPVPVALSGGLTVVLNLQIAGLISMSERFESELVFASITAFFAALIFALWVTSRSIGTVAGLIGGIVAAGAVTLLQISHGRVYSQDVVAIGSLILATMVAAHFRRGAKIEAFWYFNLQLAIAAAMG